MFDSVKINNILDCVKNQPSEMYESETIEFKEYKNLKSFYDNNNTVVAEVTAFANKQGGVLIIGVKDSNNVSNCEWGTQLVGFEVVDCLEVKKRIQGKLTPLIELEVYNHKFEELNILLIDVEQSKHGLVMTTGGKCFVRSGRDCMPMTPQEVTDKVKSSSGYDWSSEIISSMSMADALDDIQIEEAMIEYQNLNGLGEARLPKDHFLETIGVTSNGKLTNGGLLFLGKPEVIKSVVSGVEYRFSEVQQGGLIPINEVWSGSIWDAISRIRILLTSVTKYNEFIIDEKVYTYPNICRIAFEEAMVNSLIHRDYLLSGLTTFVIEGDAVTITNPGNFFGGVTSLNIFTHPPRHRNAALASILMSFELVDRAGMGTRRMNIESLRLGRNKPIFRSENNSISTTLELNLVKKGIFAIASPYDDYDVAELFLLNLLYGKGCEEIYYILHQISEIVSDPWREVNKALSRMPFLSMVGNKQGVYIVVNDSHRKLLNAYRKIKVYPSSDNYVSIFRYLFVKNEASCEELNEALAINSRDKTRRLLRDAKFVKKVKSNYGASWELVIKGVGDRD